MNDSGTDSSLSRRERERRRRRRIMLEAAQVVFAEKGYANATLDEIAERAEFGKGTLYNYFDGGKEGILFAVLDNLFAELKALIRSSMAHPERADQSLQALYHRFILDCFDFFEEREELFLLLIKEIDCLAFDNDAEHLSYFRKHQQELVSLMIPVLQEAMDRGEIKQLPVDAVAYMMFENVNGMLMHRAMLSQVNDSSDTMLHHPNQAADFLTTMLFHGLEED